MFWFFSILVKGKFQKEKGLCLVLHVMPPKAWINGSCSEKSWYKTEVVTLKICFTIRGYVTTYLFFLLSPKAERLTKNIERHHFFQVIEMILVIKMYISSHSTIMWITSIFESSFSKFLELYFTLIGQGTLFSVMHFVKTWSALFFCILWCWWNRWCRK